MPLAQNIDEIVARLEASLMPRLDQFGRSLMLSNDRVIVETFSHRHVDVVHALGLSCHPVGSDSLDPRSVALIVNVIARTRLSIKGSVAWNSPPFYHEGETAIYETFDETEITKFNEEMHGLLSVLGAAVNRGAPPGM